MATNQDDKGDGMQSSQEKFYVGKNEIKGHMIGVFIYLKDYHKEQGE